ncbi:hypothetical protein K437DRAFT_235406 [Tilletiaria anomala UBC 951]|uniref:RRM domain-containing protein n=1 Tax=Tilletiaria anomala (strain ATCC 24038 / CBS 436.72 / UBC 951) TaxID=1037660 RepID=A0A066W5Q3_TILAU|nr:uncharacterized protein K437DRAFT_235406 [Tilletiaria anomala UBC 951]KDN46125.1 hypothetical protein K437DRAFT_235406 [Tilletiaria anomala UBC 951]
MSRNLPAPANTAAGPSTIAASPFPEDPRVSFDRISGKWQCEPLAGTDDPLLEWDPDLQKWQLVIDEELVRVQQAAYSIAGVDEDAPAEPAHKRLQKRGGSAGADDNAKVSAKSNKRQRMENSGQSAVPSTSIAAQQAQLPPGKSATSIYVTNLPLDATREEIAEVFGRYGVLLEDEPGQPRIKLYYQHPDAETEEGKMFKGEALVTYFKPESVELAITVLDETCLRARLGRTKPLMRVKRAEFGKGGEKKGGSQNDTLQASSSTTVEGKGVNGAAATQSGRKQLTEQEKRKIQKRNARLNDKLNDWDSDEDSPFNAVAVKAPNAPSHPSAATELLSAASSGEMGDPFGSSAMHPAFAASNSRTVVLKHMFTLDELGEDPSLLLDLKDDVRQECENCTGGGEVTNVILYDKEEDGIMSVRFKDVESARKCVMKMNGRWFASRRIEAYLAQGRPKFRRSGVGDDDEEEREKAFGDWLEKGGGED